MRIYHELIISYKKRFYDRETNTAAFCVIQLGSTQISIPHFNHLCQSWKRGEIVSNREFFTSLIVSLK